jgi:nucleotidyltransferase substrate binding protein (TIGR01987 family)
MWHGELTMTEQDVRWQQRLSNYQKALTQLSDAVSLAQERNLSNLEEQGLVQAFEYTHELAWKTLADYLQCQGYTDLFGSKDTVRKAFSVGLLVQGDVWMDMIKSRNQTSHTYNQEVVDEIVAAIRTQYCKEFLVLQETLKRLKDAETE